MRFREGRQNNDGLVDGGVKDFRAFCAPHANGADG